ncbi:hypothetical protein D3C80_1822920 [compost metagenome]
MNRLRAAEIYSQRVRVAVSCPLIVGGRIPVHRITGGKSGDGVVCGNAFVKSQIGSLRQIQRQIVQINVAAVRCIKLVGDCAAACA